MVLTACCNTRLKVSRPMQVLHELRLSTADTYTRDIILILIGYQYFRRGNEPRVERLTRVVSFLGIMVSVHNSVAASRLSALGVEVKVMIVRSIFGDAGAYM